METLVVFNRDGKPVGYYESMASLAKDVDCRAEKVKGAIEKGDLLCGRFLVDYALDDAEIKPIAGGWMEQKGITWSFTLKEAEKVLKLVNLGMEALRLDDLKLVKYMKTKFNETVEKYEEVK